ncbi:MAG: hypothetical protein ACP5IG_04750 [Candidatus Micrarchaeia archaeon]
MPENNMTRYVLSKIVLTIDKAENNCVDNRILRYLYDKDWTPAEKIVEKLRVRSTRVFTALARLRRRGIVEKKYEFVSTKDRKYGPKAGGKYKKLRVQIVLYRIKRNEVNNAILPVLVQ